MKKIFITIMIMFLLVNVSYAASDLDSNKVIDSDEYFLYNGFRVYEDQQTNKVSYSIKVAKEIPYKFELKYYYNGEFVESCTKDILLENDEVFKKVTCEIQKLGDGEYIFDANIISSKSDYKKNNFNLEYVFEDTLTDITFEEQNDKTQITIRIDGDHEKITLKNQIPKDVIEHLDDDNKDDLIESDVEYQILESDPLIAWNIEKTPATINYSVNKKISLEQRKQFKVEITQTKSFQYLKYLMFVLIVVIIILLLKPLLGKNASKK